MPLQEATEKESLNFNQLCTFEHFEEVWSHYGYKSDFKDVIEREFSRTKGITYLDHAGTTLYPESLVREFYQDISRNVYGNPHSHNPSSRLTHDTVEHVRYRILQHFNTTPEKYSVIFTSGCTAALKLVAESFPWRPPTATEPASQFCYLTDNHTSVVGIRGVTSALGVVSLPVSPEEIEARAKDVAQSECRSGQTPHLFCYPAQSNFSGRKYSLGYVRGIQARKLYPACDSQGRWFVLLDAASFASCSPLDLQEHPADFVPFSFYKMFGFPTGLGALLVRNDTAALLRKAYFGGGTAAAYLAGENYYVPTPNMANRFEDGTVSFLDVIALNHSFDALHTLTGGMDKVQLHTFGLARYTYMLLSSLCHGNGQPVAQIYSDSEFENPSTQGAILNFNLTDCHGQIVGYSQVDKLASLFNIHVRTGCFCNTGACQLFLGITNQDVKSNLQAGHVCGDDIDLVDGRPTGSVRVSFGYMSTFQDCQNFLNFVVECFVEKPVEVDQVKLDRLKSNTSSKGSSQCLLTNGKPKHIDNREHASTDPVVNEYGGKAITKEAKSQGKAQYLTNIYIYPIKSCAAVEVTDWPVGPLGLLHDRGWMVVNGNGVCLNQKREPRLCLIHPQIYLSSNTLLLQASGMDTISVPLENHNTPHQSHGVCQSKVCGDRVQTVDCGDEAASWLSEFLGQPCRLIRQSPDFIRNMKKGHEKGVSSTALSLVNEAQYLMINHASVDLLQRHITSRQESSDHQPLDIHELISRFRANLVISGLEPFEEDDWSHLIIGNTHFQVEGRCGRCQMIGVDQNTGAKTKEPLLSLSAYRKGKVTFGVYLVHQSLDGSNATLSVGAPVMPQWSG
ncbi:molybdenum cofactor sulfurase-like isoform X1 [Salvelinus fontinalis]|uniref:molybdenum cofactor sulfurase-like isoform X1 n=1 Tax=Salvelinus fontinalis TaxID=8038 RepID=UPI00248513FA|nr:molybdenum cofactor sulfurase-like isoform X1 [Salvelinus fontinalis]